MITCPACGSEMESVHYANINMSTLECSACGLKLGPHSTPEEAEASRDRLAIAIDK